METSEVLMALHIIVLYIMPGAVLFIWSHPIEVYAMRWMKSFAFIFIVLVVVLDFVEMESLYMSLDGVPASETMLKIKDLFAYSLLYVGNLTIIRYVVKIDGQNLIDITDEILEECDK